MYKSLSGATPIQNKTPTEARTKIAYYNNTLSDGYNYCLFDIWALIALQDLCIVEFANSSAQSIVKGYTERGTQLGSTGMMDNIGNKTPIQTTGSRAIDAQQDESGNYSMKYRGIENL